LGAFILNPEKCGAYSLPEARVEKILPQSIRRFQKGGGSFPLGPTYGIEKMQKMRCGLIGENDQEANGEKLPVR
jgi:hypothetical protein